MMKNICILAVLLLLAACQKKEEHGVCPAVDQRALGLYVERYCGQVALEYYVTHGRPGQVDAYFGTTDLADEYQGNARFRQVIGTIYHELDSLSAYTVKLTGSGSVCSYKGEWILRRSDWGSQGSFVFETIPAQGDYSYWRILTPALTTGVDGFIVSRFEKIVLHQDRR